MNNLFYFKDQVLLPSFKILQKKNNILFILRKNKKKKSFKINGWSKKLYAKCGCCC